MDESDVLPPVDVDRMRLLRAAIRPFKVMLTGGVFLGKLAAVVAVFALPVAALVFGWIPEPSVEGTATGSELTLMTGVVDLFPVVALVVVATMMLSIVQRV